MSGETNGAARQGDGHARSVGGPLHPVSFGQLGLITGRASRMPSIRRGTAVWTKIPCGC